MMTKYDAFGEKNMYGKITMGIIRSTVWIGTEWQGREALETSTQG